MKLKTQLHCFNLSISYSYCFKESSTCNLEELDDDIEEAKNDLGASFICTASYDIIPKDGEGCVLYFYGTAYDTSKTENFDYVVWYVLPVLLTLGTFYYMIKEMVINIHKFLNREREKVVMKLHEHNLERKIWNKKRNEKLCILKNEWINTN